MMGAGQALVFASSGCKLLFGAMGKTNGKLINIKVTNDPKPTSRNCQLLADNWNGGPSVDGVNK